MVGREQVTTMGTSKQPVANTPWPLGSDEWTEALASLGLSPRQVKIVELVILGKKDKQIAASLGLKRSTIRTHLRRIFSHLEVADRMELALSIFSSICKRCKRNRRKECHPKGRH